MGKYATFSGRATRSEFWWFYLFTLGLTWAANIVGSVSGQDGASVLGGLVSLALFLPSLAAGCRRLHDTGRSGWWQLLGITVIGLIPLIYWYAKEGSNTVNDYGAAPAK